MKMKFNIVASWLSGFWLLVLKMKGSNAIHCHVDKAENITICTVDDTMPADLGIDNNIQSLGIKAPSRDHNKIIVANGPLKYSSLIKLVIGIPSFSAPQDFFSSLHNLKSLMFAIQFFKEDKVPDMPPSITILHVFGYSGKPLDLSKVYNLEELIYSGSNVIEFPSVPSTAPIKKLNLFATLLTNLKLPDIAQYCLLADVDLSETRIQSGSEAAYCELKAWFESHNISYKLGSDSPPKKYDSSSCSGKEIPENAEAEAKYKECLHGGLWKWIYIAIIALGFGIVLLVAIGLVYYVRRRNAANSSRDYDPDYDPEDEPDEET